jgi:UDP-glucose 4-epimerase
MLIRSTNLRSDAVISWVIGRGGLLGRNVESTLSTLGQTWHPARPFSWQDPDALEQEIPMACRAFSQYVLDRPWQVAWCAGVGAVGSEPFELQQETLAFTRLLAGMTESLADASNRRGALFLASSAGALYAGAGPPPFDEYSRVEPLASYGWHKLEQEALARQWSEESEIPLFIGRLSNLYGPGQNLVKGQGLISQICLRMMSRQPLFLYVPLDTIRDYLFARDAGRLVADGLARLQVESQTRSTPIITKILASQQPATVSTVLSQLRLVMRRPVSVTIGASPNTARQPRDLRMTSVVWPEVDQQPKTTLSEGIRWVLNDILEWYSRGVK